MLFKNSSTWIYTCIYGALLLCPCLFHPSDNVWRSRHADAPRCMHFSTVISPSWITEQISVGKCAHRGASARRKRQSSFKIVTWTKQTWTKHHNTSFSSFLSTFLCGLHLRFFLINPKWLNTVYRLGIFLIIFILF